MSGDYAANDDVVEVEDAIMLLDEIDRLNGKLASYESRLAQLDHLAHRDSLVDLYNRRSFLASLERLIGKVERYDVKAAMLFVDVDGLKAINDRLGHTAGDKALVEVARLLAASARKSDFVARLAGDEFGILLDPSDELSAWQMALRVAQTIDQYQFCLDGACLPLSVAVGVGVIARGDSPESVIARADKEMYRIKAIAGPQAVPVR